MEYFIISAWSISIFVVLFKTARELKYKIGCLFIAGLFFFGILSIISIVIFIPLFLLGF